MRKNAGTLLSNKKKAAPARVAETAAAWNTRSIYPDENPAVGGGFRVVKSDIRSDGRGRVTIGQEIVGDRQYRALINDMGQIILDPVVTVPAREIWLLKNPDAFASLVRGVEQAKRGELETFPSFAEFVNAPDDEGEPPSKVKRRRRPN